ncbi:hypothetical protein EYZ11_007221 [Aspergillus tanneri]|uniref:Uncharacterized protein n=1 Tax=Aspergillus tanneri TaxID=1220188 RepID=A0A4S3JDH7_9EURO|nr:hypothetical protein EYZ11_007221 [Aspergillus tanneri]
MPFYKYIKYGIISNRYLSTRAIRVASRHISQQNKLWLKYEPVVGHE